MTRIVKAQRIPPSKCRDLILSIVPLESYESLRAAAEQAHGNDETCRALLTARLPNWQAPAKAGIGRHPDGNIAFLILESLRLEPARLDAILGEAFKHSSELRRNLQCTLRLKSADVYNQGRYKPGDYRAAHVRAAKVTRHPPKKTRPIPTDELPDAALVQTLKTLTQLNDVFALFARVCPQWRTLRQNAEGKHNRLALRAMVAAEFTSRDIKHVMKDAGGLLYVRTKAMKLKMSRGPHRLIHT